MARLVLSASLAAVLLSGCGAVGEPLPPLLHIPGRAQDVTARQQAATVVVEWTWPFLTTEGQTNDEIAHFTVYALPVSAGAEAPAPESFEDWGAEAVARLEGERLESVAPGDRLRLEIDAADRLGERVAYAVLSENRRGRVAPMSAAAVVDLIRPPAPPAALEAAAEPDGVRLQWEAPDGAARYAIERRIGERGEFQQIGQVAETTFLDRGPLWESPNAYRVRPLADGPQGAVPGRATEPVELTPVDRFPPAPPDQLRAVIGPESVELTWAPAGEPDTAGYRVYRDGEVLGEELLLAPAFSDREVERGRTYRYQVTAEDEKGNQSERSAAVDVAFQ